MEVHRLTLIVLPSLLHHSIALNHKDRYTGVPLMDSLASLSKEVLWSVGTADLNSFTMV